LQEIINSLSTGGWINRCPSRPRRGRIWLRSSNA